MCGIAGIAAFAGTEDPPATLVGKMVGTLAHRGPDDSVVECREGVGLAMRRLSIIDLSGGRQPLRNEDGMVRLVFNGEIYNFRELRRELEDRGHRFSTGSDGEVALHLYEEEGERFVERLNGMFAIALHDLRRRRLLLARDRLGIKPLYWSMGPRGLVFGSEVKALLASGWVERELDLDGLNLFLSWEYVPGERTLLRAVRKLEPGRTMELDLETGQPRFRTYWDVPVPEGRKGGGEGDGIGTGTGNGNGNGKRACEWEEAVAEKLSVAVKRQLVSDVPLGAFLSGGVDSSLVASFMGPGQAFSIGFEDPSYDELPWARRVARHLGLAHRVEVIRPDTAALFDKLMHFLDDPIGDFSIFPTFLVSQLARREVTVVLSGDGGDELFGGYESYLAQRAATAWRRIPAPLRRGLLEPLLRRLRPREKKKGLVNRVLRFLEGLEHGEELGHARWRLFLGEARRNTLLTPEARARLSVGTEDHIVELFRLAGDRPALDRALYVDLKSYLSDNILAKVDRMSMACSLEARVPWLDHELVELAFRVPEELKVRGKETKLLLKRLAARRVPRECVFRAKEGFSIPLKAWLRGELRPILEERLEPRRLAAEGIFQPQAVETLKREHLEGRANHSHLLWCLLVFQDWRLRWGA